MKADFSRKTAIVTGGTRGIGRAIVELLQRAGCAVTTTGTKPLAEDCTMGTHYAPLDLSDEGSITHFIAQVVEKTPSIDILVNNAGVNLIEPIDEIQDDHWRHVLQVNLTGAMIITRAVARAMKKSSKGGKIVNVASIWGIISKPKRGAYSASKAGLIGLTRAAALDLAPFNILVNALCPGFTKTELTTSILGMEEMDALMRQVPLRRFAEVEEIALVAAFLCSDFNTYITGQTIVVDGGFTIR